MILGCTMLGYPLGPLLGGWLLERFWGGSVFLINVPVVAMALVAIAVLMPESRGARPSRLDRLGVVLSSLGLVGITYGVIQAGQEGWSSARAVAGLVIGAVALSVFVAWERRIAGLHREPLVDLGLFRSARFTWGAVLATMVSFAMFGLLLAMPQYFQAVMGQDPLGSGIRLLPLIGGLVVGAALATRLQGARHNTTRRRRDRRRQGWAPTSWWPLALLSWPRASSSVQPPRSAAVRLGRLLVRDLRPRARLLAPGDDERGSRRALPDRAGTGSGLIMACRQVGATIGVALLGNILNSEYRDRVNVAISPRRQPRWYEGRGHGDAGCAAARGCGARALGPVRVRHLARRHAVRVRCHRARCDGSGLRLLPGRRAVTPTPVPSVASRSRPVPVTDPRPA